MEITKGPVADPYAPGRVATALLAAVLVLTGIATFTLAPLFVFAGEPCAPVHAARICGVGQRNLLMMIPQVASPLVVAGSLIGTYRHNGRSAWARLGLGLLALVWIVNAMLTAD